MAKTSVAPTLPNKQSNLKIRNERNSGAWGVVYNRTMDRRTVAVKKIHELLQYGVKEEERRKVFNDFREECKRLQALSHPHVVGR